MSEFQEYFTRESHIKPVSPRCKSFTAAGNAEASKVALNKNLR
jgi:hypothetical protein